DLDRIADDAAADSGYIAAKHRVETHDGAVWVVVVRSQAVGPRFSVTAPADSDEVLVFNESDAGLTLNYRLQPRAKAPVDVPRVKPPPPQPNLFDLRDMTDLDDNGEPDVYGAFHLFGMQAVDPLPVFLSQYESTGNYFSTALNSAIGLYHNNYLRWLFAR